MILDESEYERVRLLTKQRTKAREGESRITDDVGLIRRGWVGDQGERRNGGAEVRRGRDGGLRRRREKAVEAKTGEVRPRCLLHDVVNRRRVFRH